MKKIFTLLTLLLCAVTSSWADDVTTFNFGGASDAVAGDLTAWTTSLSEGSTAKVLLGSATESGKTIKKGSSNYSGAIFELKNVESGGTSTLTTKSSYNSITKITFNITGSDSGKSYLTVQISPDEDFSVPANIVTLINNKNLKDDLSVSSNGTFSSQTCNLAAKTGYIRFTFTNNSGSANKYYMLDDVEITYTADTRDPLSLSFTPDNQTIADGGTLSTAFSILTDISGESAKYSSVTYSSTDEAIATVNSSGVVTGVAVGTTTIKATVTATADATYKTTTASITVTVYDPADYYTLSTTSASISLNKTNINAQAYLAVTTDNWSNGSNPYDEIDPPFYNMSNVGRDLTIKVIGVAGFMVRDYNGTAGRTYGISVNGEEKAVVTHGGTGVESSPVIATGSTDAVTIKLSGKGTGSTYPVRIILYANIESVPVGATGWSTYSTDKALDFTGLEIEAYQVTGYEGTAITKEQITGTVAANTGLLVKGTANKTYVVPVVASGTNYSATNMMVESVSGGTVNAGDMGVVNYVLMNVSGNAVFQWIGSTPATLGANKAYLSIPGGPTPAGARGLEIDGDVTAIKNIKVGTEDNVYYDLQGRRVLYPTKGLYIVNGKKVIVK